MATQKVQVKPRDYVITALIVLGIASCAASGGSNTPVASAEPDRPHWAQSAHGQMAYRVYMQRIVDNCTNRGYSYKTCEADANKTVVNHLNANWYPGYRIKW